MRDGTYYSHSHVRFQKEPDTDVSTVESGTVLGIDSNGDGYLAVTSTSTFLGNADPLTHRRDQYERKRGNLQETETKSTHLTIQPPNN
jgi:transposase